MGQTVYPPTAGAPPSSPQLGHQPPQVNYQPTAISAPAQPPAQPCHPPNPQESNFFPSAGIYANASGYTGQPPHQLYRQSSYISGDYQSEKVVAAAYQTPSPDPVAQTHYATSSQTPSEYQAHATTGYPAQPPTVIMNSPLGQQQPGYTTPTVVVPAKCQTEPVMGNPIHSPMPMPQPQPMAIVHQLGRQSSYIPSVVEQPQSGPYYQPTQQLAGGGYAASGSTYQAQCFPPQEVVYGGQFSSYPATPSAALVPAERPAGGGLQYSVIPNPVPVVGLQYCLPRPVELMMVRKLTLSSDFTVMDVARTPIFKVKGKVVGDKRMLLDAAGIPVFSLNTKLLSMYRRWQVYKGASTHPTDLIFSARTSSVVQLKTKLNVYLASRVTEDFSDFKVEGSWSDGSCTVYLGETPTVAARMNKLDNAQSYFLGKDTFMITVSPNIDYAFVVALILILDAINSTNSNITTMASLFLGIPIKT